MKKTRKYKNPLRVRNRENRDPLESLQIKNKMLVSARIDDIRIELGLSKSGFAELVGQKPSVITKWLSGTHNFTQDTYTLIEHKTGKNIFKGIMQGLDVGNVSLRISYSKFENDPYPNVMSAFANNSRQLSSDSLKFAFNA